MITNDELLKEVSLKELKELSDFNGDDSINQDIINDCIKDRLNYIASFIKIPTNPTPLLKDIHAKLVIIELKRRNNFPKDSLKEQEEHLERLLLKMAAKKIPTELKDEDNFTPKITLRAFRHDNEKMNLEGLNG